jgi:biopolymer transport protein ExbB
MLALLSPQLAKADTIVKAQVEASANDTSTNSAVTAVTEIPDDIAVDNSDIGFSEAPGFTEVIKQRFIEGGVGFMICVLLCLILGIAISIERIIYLSLSTVNTTQLLQKVEVALSSGGIEEAKEVCRNTRGPVASIFYDGLTRADEGIEQVEKAVIAGGSVQMGLMEKGISWISLFIALAPMLGFLGTVLGMIEAFDSIAEAGTVEPALMADDIKMALITTVAGLIVAIFLQLFYNIIISKIDNLVNNMENSSNVFVKIVQQKIG